MTYHENFKSYKKRAVAWAAEIYDSKTVAKIKKANNEKELDDILKWARINQKEQ